MKIATSLKKVTPLFPSNPPLKVEVLSSPLFENLDKGSTLPWQKGGGGGSTLLCFGIWWFHEIWKSKILKFDFLENGKNFNKCCHWDLKNKVPKMWRTQPSMLSRSSRSLLKFVLPGKFFWNFTSFWAA